MAQAINWGTAVLIREIAVGAGDDPDWHTANSVPADADQLTHLTSGSIHLYFVLRDVNGDPVAPGAATFTFELMRVFSNFTTAGTEVTGAAPNEHWTVDIAPAGNYGVRVSSKANMSGGGATHLQIYGQST